MKYLKNEISYMRKELFSVREELNIVANNRQVGGGLFQSLESLAIRIAKKLLTAANKPNPIIKFNWCGNDNEFHLGLFFSFINIHMCTCEIRHFIFRCRNG